MRSLSNLFRGSDPPPEPLDCRPAHQDEARPALGLILGSQDPAAIAQFLAFADTRQVSLADLWVAREGDRLWWAVLPMLSPGRTMLLFSPAAARDPGQARAAEQLAGTVCEHYRRRDVDLAQVLLDPEDPHARRGYESAGFRPMAELDYLQADLHRRVPPPPLPAGFSLLSYSPQTHAVFAHTILATYEDSRDCPALNGLRDIEDVILGHKAAGVFDPAYWWLLREGDAAVGVLLLNAAAGADAMELVYLGLARAARGRGLGDLLMRQALAATHAAAKRHLALAVDAANPPALKLYFRHGLRRIGQKLALMRDLRPRTASAHSADL